MSATTGDTADADRPAADDGEPTDARETDGRATPSALDRLLLFAREDARDAVRERQAYVLGALFGLVGAGIAYGTGRTAAGMPPGETIALAPRLLGPLALLAPLIALGFVAPGLVQKRSNGALTVLLGQPFSRRTVVLGYLLGRYAVVGGAVVLAVAAGAAVGTALGVTVGGLDLLVGTVALLALTATFVALAVAISVHSPTSTQATAGAVGAYVLFGLDVWRQLVTYLYAASHGFDPPAPTAPWVETVAALNPSTAFGNLLGGVSEAFVTQSVGRPELSVAAERPAFAAVILIGWFVLATALAVRRFERLDL